MLPFQVQRWFHGQWFSMWIHTAKETDVWPLLFKSSACVICSWVMPASIFKRDIDSPWPCPWAYVFPWTPSWRSTKAQGQECSPSCPHPCPMKHTVCELAFEIFYVAFLHITIALGLDHGILRDMLLFFGEWWCSLWMLINYWLTLLYSKK